jgi:methionyl aminopeptidase
MITQKTLDEIIILREGGRRLAKIVRTLGEMLAPGVALKELDKKAKVLMKEFEVKPAFLNYTPGGAKRPFPSVLCICVNDEIVHGVPSESGYVIKDGDIVTLDAGVIYKGLYTDHAITYPVGKIPMETKRLLKATKEALQEGINAIKVGGHIGDIGEAVERVALRYGFSIINGLAGHGVGYAVHEDPYVPNFGKHGEGEELISGMVIAIEPMFSAGSPNIKLLKDGYTYSTKDGSLSAQFEHTVAITDEGPIILTKE